MTSERLVSLLEILRVYASDFVGIMANLKSAVTELRDKDIWEEHKLRAFLALELEELKEICAKGELSVTKILANDILTRFEAVDGEANIPEKARQLMREIATTHLIKHDLLQLCDRFKDELSTKLFFQIHHDRRKYFDSPLEGWARIVDRFPDSIRDVEEMNKCFVLSRYTASMFHAMHVAECGAIDLGLHIGVVDHVRGWGATDLHPKSVQMIL